MRLKDLFIVPEGQKVTEKQFRRVLISSICSILLCMTCLVSTTWAWFAVSIENAGNTIEIATITASVNVTKDGTSVAPQNDGSYTLDSGNYSISVGLEQPDKTPADANLLNASQCPVYVVMTVRHGENVEYRIFTFSDRENKQNHQLTVGKSAAMVSFSVSWIKPAFDIQDGSEPVVIGEIPTEPATEPSTETTTTPSTEHSTGGTDPAEEPSSEPATEPSTETTTTEATEAATEAATIPTTTGETIEPTPATEETTIPAAEATTTPTTAPTSIPTEATEPITESEETTSPTGTG